MGRSRQQPARWDDIPLEPQGARRRLRRAMMLGAGTFVVSLCFFGVVFLVLLGSNWRAGAAMYAAAAVCTGIEVWRIRSKRI